MSTFTESVQAIEQNIGALTEQRNAAYRRIHELQTALNRMVLAHENTLADSEGKWPAADCGCIYCTQGQVPDKLNTGPCAYHNGKKLLGQL